MKGEGAVELAIVDVTGGTWAEEALRDLRITH